MTERIRVLIVDDQRLLCEGFRKLIELEPSLAVVGRFELALRHYLTGALVLLR